MADESAPAPAAPDRFWLLDLVVPLTTTIFAGAVFLDASDVSGLARTLVMCAFVSMLGIYYLVRSLRTHATLTRLAAIGDADELVRLADIQLRRSRGPARFVARLSGSRPLPFHIYKAIGLWQLGDDAAAETELGRAADSAAGRRVGATWQYLHDSTLLRIHCLRGDATAARALWDGRMSRQLGAGALADLERREAQALLAWAEGDDAGCAALAARLANENRLAAAPRALYHYLAGAALERAGDRVAAAPHLAEAAALAPQTFIASRAAAASV